MGGAWTTPGRYDRLLVETTGNTVQRTTVIGRRQPLGDLGRCGFTAQVVQVDLKASVFVRSATPAARGVLGRWTDGAYRVQRTCSSAATSRRSP